MNCQPGDIARVIDDESSRALGVVDRFFKLKSVCGHTNDGAPCWTFEGEPIRHPQNRLVAYDAISDDILRPVRDPGEDARDETLDWLPVPSKQGETA